VLLHTTSIANIFILSIPHSGKKTSRQKPTLKTKNLVFMKTKSFAPMGSLHPILFFAVLYIVALVFAIFICSSLFYSCNVKVTGVSSENSLPVEKPGTGVVTVAMR
jgi:hypothetical protein